MVRVKICGITNWRDARLALDAGADALGFNFYSKSPRVISVEEARTIIQRLPRRILAVGVFVNESYATILRMAPEADLNALQLHGEESPETLRLLAPFYPVIKAFRVTQGFRAQRLSQYGQALAFLLDGYRAHIRGGTGRMFDWRIAARAKRYGRVILAGGLRPENVAEAIAAVKPFAIDVCSGVESAPGRKDPQRLRELMAAVDAARKRWE